MSYHIFLHEFCPKWDKERLSQYQDLYCSMFTSTFNYEHPVIRRCITFIVVDEYLIINCLVLKQVVI